MNNDEWVDIPSNNDEWVDIEIPKQQARKAEPIATKGKAPLPPYTLKEGKLVETEIPKHPQNNPTLTDNLLGGLEAGATLISGATTGAAGNIYGTMKGFGKELLNGEFGTPAGAKRIEKKAQDYGSHFTYEPKTKSGQNTLKSIASVLTPLEALTPLGGQAKAITSSLKTPNAIQGGMKVYANNKNEKKALKQGIDKNILKTIRESSGQDKEKMIKMLDIYEQGKNSAESKALNRPSDAVGETLGNKVDFLLDTNRKAGSEIELTANNLKGKAVNTDKATNNLVSNLDKIGITLTRDGNKVKIKLKGSDIEGDSASQKLLKKIFNRLSSTNSSDGYGVHNTKRFIDTQLSYGKTKANPLSKKTENILKEFRSNLKDSLGESSPEYKNANTKYSETIRALDAIQGNAGSKVDLTSPNASKALGVTLRKLLSNNSSRANLIDALQNTDNITKKYGLRSDDNLIKQVVFANEIDRLFGSQAPTSFKGQIEQAADNVASFATQSTPEKASTLTRALLNKISGKSEDNAVKALYKLINDTAPSKVKHTKSSSINNLINKALGKYENSE